MSKEKGLMKVKEAHELIASMQERIAAVLPKHITPERMMRVAQNAMSRNPKLLTCTRSSLMNAVMTASEFGLEVNTPLGLAYIIPYKNDATFQIGYQGLLMLCRRSAIVENIIVEAVHEKDEFRITKGLHPDIYHVPNMTSEPGRRIGIYAAVFIKESAPTFTYMTAEDIEAFARRFSKSYAKDIKYQTRESFWSKPLDDPGRISMEKKTVLIRAMKYAPKSIVDERYERAFREADDCDVVPFDDAIDVAAMVIPQTGQTLDDLVDPEFAPEEKQTELA